MVLLLLVAAGCSSPAPERVAQRLYERLDAAVRTGFDGRTGEFRPRRVAGGPDRVRLAIGSGASERLLELVDEDGWKLDLEATFELNREVATSVK
jgi:hypothetical protein